MNSFNSLALTLIFSILFIGCTSVKPNLYTNPKWYKNRTVQSQAKYEIIGYGKGKTIKEAEAKAKEDVAQTLLSRVDSSIVFTTSESNGDLKTHADSNLKVTSRLNLQNVKMIKQEQMGNNFFVVLKYDNLDLASKIKKSLQNIQCSDKRMNSYLSQAPLMKETTASLGCKLDFKLKRRNRAWYIKYKEHLYLLNESEFEELFATTTNSNFGFVPSKNILVDGDAFYFTFHSKDNGYITLLDVYANGIVTLIQPSILIKDRLQIPSKESKNYFEAGVIKKGVDTYDLYVAIFSKKPLDMSRFMYASEDLSSSELAYKFDELIRVMNGHRYSTVLTRTRAK